jgi:MFS superfamily sulfate permease-like transporter
MKRKTIDVIKYIRNDAQAGIVTGVMAIPLSVGICILSDYPIQNGLFTVIFACIIGFTTSLFKTGNYIGVPGIAAGLAPALALGVHTFGMQNMPFLIFLTAVVQIIAWRFEMHQYLLKYVPHYLVEGLLAGIGLKIVLKFIPFLYDTTDHQINITDPDFITVVFLSATSFMIFYTLFKKYRKKAPGISYFTIIGIGVIASLLFDLPKIEIGKMGFELKLPFPYFENLQPFDLFIMWLRMIGFSIMLASIDIIEQSMSNVAIEKIDPLKRKCDTKNSLFAIWIANLGASFFGGMTNLDGLAKSTTNALSGARTKLSNLFVAAVVSLFLIFPAMLSFIPNFALGIIMVFTGWKMIAGLKIVIHEGNYPLLVAIMCGLLVFRLGIFEGLLITLLVHGLIKSAEDNRLKTFYQSITKKAAKQEIQNEDENNEYNEYSENIG